MEFTAPLILVPEPRDRFLLAPGAMAYMRVIRALEVSAVHALHQSARSRIMSNHL